MHTPSLPSRASALKRAAMIAGGERELAARLQVPERQLAYWMRDIGTPPDTVYFDVIQIIIECAGTRPAERLAA